MVGSRDGGGMKVAVRILVHFVQVFKLILMKCGRLGFFFMCLLIVLNFVMSYIKSSKREPMSLLIYTTIQLSREEAINGCKNNLGFRLLHNHKPLE